MLADAVDLITLDPVDATVVLEVLVAVVLLDEVNVDDFVGTARGAKEGLAGLVVAGMVGVTLAADGMTRENATS